MGRLRQLPQQVFRVAKYSVGETICGDTLRSYLFDLGVSSRGVESIMDGIRQGFKFTTLAISLRGRAIDWDQYRDPPVGGTKSRAVAERIARKGRGLFRLELWEHRPPDCMILRDSKGVLGFLGPLSPGLELR